MKTLTAFFTSLAMLSSCTAIAQTYIMPATDSIQIITCSGTISDPGGTGSYANNTQSWLTIRPSDSLAFVSLSFSLFDTENNYDRLNVHNGTTSSAPLIATYSGTSAVDVYATNVDGALTLHFYSNNSVTREGFVANITCIDSVPMPDLLIESALINSGAVFAGGSVSTSTSIFNNSAVESRQTSIAYYFSTDTVLDGSDILIGTKALSELTGGDRTTISQALVIPGYISQGEYYIIFYADNSQSLTELDETNNLAFAPITVIGVYADLFPKVFYLNTVVTSRGGEVTAYSSIMNYGTGTAPASFTGFYYSMDSLFDGSDVLLAESAVSQIPPQQTSVCNLSIPIPDTASSGMRFLIMRSDDHDTIQEIDEANNTQAIRFYVNENMPDLTILSFAPSVSQAISGQTITVSYNITNTGQTTAFSSKCGVYLSLDTTWDLSDIFLSAYDGPSLNPSFQEIKNLNATLPGGLTAGTYYLLVYADYFNEVIEVSEDNNIFYTPINISELRTDYQMNALFSNTHYIMPGGSANLNCTVTNNGSSNSPVGKVGYFFSIDQAVDGTDILLDSNNIGSVAPGSSAYSSASITIPAGTLEAEYYLIAYADFRESVSEYDETNNVSLIPITISGPGADLAPTVPSYIGTGTCPDGTLSISFKTNNYGNQNTGASMSVVFLSSDSLLDVTDSLVYSVALTAVNAGSLSSHSASIHIPASTLPGDYFLLYIADFQDEITELNEDNNLFALPLSIRAPFPDLVIQTPTLSVSSIGSGLSLSATCKIANIGTYASSIGNIGYYLSTDTVFDGGDVFLDSYNGSGINAGSVVQRAKTLTIPGGTTTGSYYIIFFADFSLIDSEESETNNFAWCRLEVLSSNTDLLTCNASINIPMTTSGASITLGCKVKNQGTVVSIPSVLTYYFSNDTIADGSDIVLGSTNISTITAGSQATDSKTVTVPTGLAPGTYYIIFSADNNNIITEPDEENNLVCLPVFIIPEILDINLQSANLSLTYLPVGSPLTARASFRNQGTVSTGSFRLGFYFSNDTIWDAGDTLLDISAVSSISPESQSSESKYITMPTNVAPGTYYLILYADDQHIVGESDENNNTAYRTINLVENTIDLIIASHYLTYSTVLQGGNIGINSTIRNDGNTSASSSHIGYYISDDPFFDATDILIGTYPGSSLLEYHSHAVSSSIPIPDSISPGQYYLLRFVDYDLLVDESDETNNMAFDIFNIEAPLYDLEIQAQAVSPMVTSCDSTIHATFSIYNNEANKVPTSHIGYFLSADQTWDPGDILLGNTTAGPISMGSYINLADYLTIPAGIPDGTWYILFYADYDEIITETDETNNVAFAAISIYSPFPDLAITAANLSSTYSSAGDGITCYATIRNLGQLEAASSSNVGYYFSEDDTLDGGDILLNSSSGGLLNPDMQAVKSAVLQIPGTVSSGLYYILIEADYNDQVAEGNENNNVFSILFTVTSTDADLIVSNGTVTPSTITAGDSASVSATIQNIGMTTATSSNIGFYLSADNQYDIGDQLLTTSAGGILPSMASIVKTADILISSSTAPGNYYILCFADNLNILAEGNETNNVFAISITIVMQLPDLHISTASVVPDTIEPGGQTDMNFTIANAGAATAPTSYTGFYLSVDTIWDQTDTYLSFLSGGSISQFESLSQATVISIPPFVSVGNYYLLVYADYIDNIEEVSEVNNVFTLPVYIETSVEIRSETDINDPITVFPNPCQGRFRIRCDNFEGNPYLIIIRNSLGQIVFGEGKNDFVSSHEFVFSGHGVYFVEFFVCGNMYAWKIISE